MCATRASALRFALHAKPSLGEHHLTALMQRGTSTVLTHALAALTSVICCHLQCGRHRVGAFALSAQGVGQGHEHTAAKAAEAISNIGALSARYRRADPLLAGDAAADESTIWRGR